MISFVSVTCVRSHHPERTSKYSKLHVYKYHTQDMYVQVTDSKDMLIKQRHRDHSLNY